jgi:hypothetical protein
MKLSRQCSFTILLAFFISTRVVLPESNRLEGCQDPQLTASALAKLRSVPWRDISLDRLRAMWPGQVDGLDCDADHCTSLWTKGRIISGHCECCELFYFGTDGMEAMSGKQRLDAVVINYSTSSRAEAIETAKLYAKAVGVPMNLAPGIGNHGTNEFSWDGSTSGESAYLNVKFRRTGALWTLNLYLSRDREATISHERLRDEDKDCR